VIRWQESGCFLAQPSQKPTPISAGRRDGGARQKCPSDFDALASLADTAGAGTPIAQRQSLSPLRSD